MNFEFSDEQRTLRDHARKFLAERGALAGARRVMESDAPYDDALWRGMVEMAWPATAIPERYGGAGFGPLELCVIAEELGRTLAATPFSSSAYLATEALLLAGSPEQREQYLPKLATGEWVGCLAVAEGPRAAPLAKMQTRVHGRAISGTKLPVADGLVSDFAIVAAREEGGAISLVLVDLSTSGITRQELATIDPTRSHAQITFDSVAAEPLGPSGAGMRLLAQLFDRAAVLFAFEQVGGAQAALDMAKEYALARFAFGRPIGSFQAIKHKLAEVYIAVELARSNAYYGAWALSTNAPELPVGAAAARVSASEAFYHAAKENIQTHGGMGFTWEFDCHMYYRRAKLLALVLGSPRRWKHELVTRIEAARST